MIKTYVYAYFLCLAYSQCGKCHHLFGVAVMAALFTYRNMGEVVSRRIICHNSRVSLFEFYTFNRFVAVLSGLSSLGLFVFVGRLLVGKVME